MVAVLIHRHAKKGVAMQSSTPALKVALPPVPVLFSSISLYAHLLTLTDQRDPRGVRYPLGNVDLRAEYHRTASSYVSHCCIE